MTGQTTKTKVQKVEIRGYPIQSHKYFSSSTVLQKFIAQKSVRAKQTSAFLEEDEGKNDTSDISNTFATSASSLLFLEKEWFFEFSVFSLYQGRKILSRKNWRRIR